MTEIPRGSPDPKPPKSLEDVGLHVRDSQEQANFRGKPQSGEQSEAEEFDFDLGEMLPAIWKCSLPYPSHSKSNEEPNGP